MTAPLVSLATAQERVRLKVEAGEQRNQMTQRETAGRTLAADGRSRAAVSHLSEAVGAGGVSVTGCARSASRPAPVSPKNAAAVHAAGKGYAGLPVALAVNGGTSLQFARRRSLPGGHR